MEKVSADESKVLPGQIMKLTKMLKCSFFIIYAFFCFLFFLFAKTFASVLLIIILPVSTEALDFLLRLRVGVKLLFKLKVLSSNIINNKKNMSSEFL